MFLADSKTFLALVDCVSRHIWLAYVRLAILCTLQHFLASETAAYSGGELPKMRWLICDLLAHARSLAPLARQASNKQLDHTSAADMVADPEDVDVGLGLSSEPWCHVHPFSISNRHSSPTCQEGLQRQEQGRAVDADALRRGEPELGRQQQLARAACAAEDSPAQPAMVPRPRQWPTHRHTQCYKLPLAYKNQPPMDVVMCRPLNASHGGGTNWTVRRAFYLLP